MAASYNREQIRAALRELDANFSNYLDLESGIVLRVSDTDEGAEAEQVRSKIMDGYGDRYRYIPGGNGAADDAEVRAWLEAEGL